MGEQQWCAHSRWETTIPLRKVDIGQCLHIHTDKKDRCPCEHWHKALVPWQSCLLNRHTPYDGSHLSLMSTQQKASCRMSWWPWSKTYLSFGDRRNLCPHTKTVEVKEQICDLLLMWCLSSFLFLGDERPSFLLVGLTDDVR